MWQAEAALRDFGDDGKNCAALIQHLRYQLHEYKGLVPGNEEKICRDIPEEWIERLNQKSTLKEWAAEVAKRAPG